MEAHRPHGTARLHEARAALTRWKTPLAAAVLAAALLPAEALAQRAVLVVRHAERAREGPETDIPLSKTGAEHAARLAEILKTAGVTAVYATDTTRARQTGEPLAQMLKLTIKIYDTRDEKGNMTAAPLTARLKADEKDGVVLVVGHSNTVPDILAAYGAKEPVRIGPDDYGDLFVLVPQPSGPPVVIRLRF
jgi:broad specificity phosphatase PhoE